MSKKVADMSLENEEIIDEKKLLKEAEEREKERKAEEKTAKEEAKEEEKGEKKEKIAEEIKKRKPQHGKKYRELVKQIEKDKEYPISEAIDLTLKTSPAKFDATVEFHAKLTKKEKNIRGMVTLPGGLAKEKKILEITSKNVEDSITKIKAGKAQFDLIIADIKLMPQLAVLAKILGPKGLMPSPKAGTAVEDVAKAVAEMKGGRVEYRADKDNNVHLSIGRVSFGPEKIYQNFEAILHALPKKLESIHLTTTMGPSIRVAKK